MWVKRNWGNTGGRVEKGCASTGVPVLQKKPTGGNKGNC